MRPPHSILVSSAIPMLLSLVVLVKNHNTEPWRFTFAAIGFSLFLTLFIAAAVFAIHKQKTRNAH